MTVSLTMAAEQVIFVKTGINLYKSGQQSGLTGINQVDGILRKYNASQAVPLFNNMDLTPASGLLDWLVVSVPDGADTDDLVEQLAGLSAIKAVSRNHTFTLDYIPNDTQFSEQWAMDKISAPAAWDIEQGDQNVLIAIIDTGIDYLHGDLSANVWINPGEDLNHNGIADFADYNDIDDDGNGYVDDILGWDFTDAPNYPDGGDYLERDNDPMDEMGHGTGVAGLVAAVADNQKGIAGAAHGCQVMALRAFTMGGYGEEDDVASAIVYAVQNGARVINMSWGDDFATRLLQDVVRYAASQGVVMVASAGNSSTDTVHYPSGFPETISVGSTTDEDELSGFSNYGPLVDLVAPGSDVLTTDLEDSYTTMNGTSFAGPFVSAAAALVLSQQPELGPDAVKGRLVETADDIGQSGIDPYFRAGRLNLYNLVSVNSEIIAGIDSPYLDQGISAGPVEIHGSAWSPSMEKYSLWWGSGANPDEWQVVTEIDDNRVLDGYLGQWADIPEEDGEYCLKVIVQDHNGKSAEGVTRIFIDRTEPVISDVELLPMYDGNQHAVLVGFTTDDLCEGTVWYRPQNTSGEFMQSKPDYRTRDLRYLLTQNETMENIEIKLEAVNGAGLFSHNDNNGQYYQATLDLDPVNNSRYTPVNYLLPFGHLLNKSFDFNNNGRPEMVLSADENGGIGPVQFWEYGPSENVMVQVAELDEDRIPRDLADITGDGIPELLCGFGFTSYIYSKSAESVYPVDALITFEGASDDQYWASRFTDLDQDGVTEVILRTVTGSTDHFEVWEWDGSAFSPVANLENPTDGENINGVPHIETGDFDNDGLKEILLGDSDGDLYIFENSADNQYTQTWQYRLPMPDAIDFIRAGDFDGDGDTEFVAGCHADPNLNTEHEYDARHWYYAVFDMSGDDQYAPVADWRFFGFESVRDYPAGVTSGNLDDDPAEEIIVNVFPDMYVIEYDGEKGYHIAWHHQTVVSNTAIIADADADGMIEYFVGNGQYTRSFQLTSGLSGPAVPSGVNAQPLNGSHVLVSWRSVGTGAEYIIYRGTGPLQLQPVFTTSETQWLDESVTNGDKYWYAVQTSSGTGEKSLLSTLVSAVPGPRPYVVSAQQENERSINLIFSQTMSASVKNISAYSLLPGALQPTSAAMASGSQIILTWDQSFANEGTYTLSCTDLTDINGVPLDTLQNSAGVQISLPVSLPYLVDGQLAGNTLRLTFSEAMNVADIENMEHYDLGEDISVKSVQAESDSQVVLQLESSIPLNIPGKSIEVKVSNMHNQQGIAIQSGHGDKLRLLFSATDLSQVITFPNPWHPHTGADGITFGNLTQSADIRIMTETGITVRQLSADDGDGGVEWDLRNEQGEAVASGIYIYRIDNSEQTIRGKLAIVR